MDEMTTARRSERTQRGFTLLEVMLALSILAFGMLALAIMQLYAMRQGSMGRHSGDGAAIARSYLEQAARLNWTTALTPAATAGGWLTPGWAGMPSASVVVQRPGGATSTTEKAYTVDWRVTNVGTGTICLRDIEVRVTWSEEESSVNKVVTLGTRRYNQGDDNC
jgi:prepilin-type N-terminal cleavage/methylation domain-containing protein